MSWLYSALLPNLHAHLLKDFALQGTFMSIAKNRNANLTQFFPNDDSPPGLWWNALFAHSLIHAGGVWLVTGSVFLALLELVLHFVIDYCKCEGWINFAMDQTLHRLCKVLFVVLLLVGWPPCLDWNPLATLP